ncbi:MAG: hypothetical protein ACREFE_01850 [Limisphaerales bacterium]
MKNSPFGKLFAGLVILIAVLVIALHFLNRGTLSPPAPVSLAPTNHFALSPFVFHHPQVQPTEQPQANATRQPKISREKVEAWLAKHNRDAMSLLTARALNDTNYLNEAATNFPNNPQVELAVLAHDEFPADRRKWLDLIKASSPSNSLANYLSAQDYLKNGNSAAAIQELLAADGKSQFDAFQTENLLDAEDLYSSSGDSAKETATFAMADMSEEDLPEMATLKRLSQGIGDLEQQYLNSGDADSAANLAEMGMTYANRLESGDSGKYIINQLVGIAVESVVLQKLDPNTSYDFLNGETPSQVVQEDKQQRQATMPTYQDFQAVYPRLTDDEIANYFKRVEIYGELDAMKWVIQQHPSNSQQ